MSRTIRCTLSAVEKISMQIVDIMALLLPMITCMQRLPGSHSDKVFSSFILTGTLGSTDRVISSSVLMKRHEIIYYTCADVPTK